MRVASALGVGFAALLLMGACGPDRPPAATDTLPSGESSGGGKPVFTADAGAAPPGCGVRDDGSTCDCVDVPLFVNPPTIYFVLDRSGSMRAEDRWTQVRMTVANVMRSLGPRASFGATIFPSDASSCGPGYEVLPITAGDPPSSGLDGPAVKRLIATTAVPPNGGTPTAATLASVEQYVGTMAGRAYIILATDGAPNCNPAAGCGIDQCQHNIESARFEDVQCLPDTAPNCCAGPHGANCNDGPATIAALTRLRTRGIPTYVVGLPGTEFPAYAQLLDQMAEAGGTAQVGAATRYFAVQRGSSDEVLVALKKIAAQITGTCEFDLTEPPLDASLVNVYIDDVVLPQEPVNGWTIEGKTVTLVGASCARVKSGDVLGVRIIAGCPTVLPK